jgi:hypothetical protein
MGPTVGTLSYLGIAASIPSKYANGKDITDSQKRAVERLMPFNTYAGIQQFLRYFVHPPEANYGYH